MQPLTTKKKPIPDDQNHRSCPLVYVAELLCFAATAEAMPVEWAIDYSQSGGGRTI